MSSMPKYAEKTTVSARESQYEIERTLMRFGASKFVYAWKETAAVIGFEMNGKQVRFVLPMPSRSDPQITKTPARGQTRTMEQQEKAYEQAVRQKWRALAATIKAKFAACEAGISIFEREFFYDIVLPSGQTVGEYIMPQVEQSCRTGEMPPMLPMWGEEV